MKKRKLPKIVKKQQNSFGIVLNRKKREFFKKAGEKFPNYDFSIFNYTGCRNKSIIICPEHGSFLAHASSVYMAKYHLCPECRKEHFRLTPEQFIKKVHQVHGKRYKYNKESVKKASSHDFIKIRCRQHGLFEQNKGSHLAGSGCPKCYEEERSEKARQGVLNLYKTTVKERHAQFIIQAVKKFGTRYDYSDVFYINGYTPVEIICPDHGKFKMRPCHHLTSYTGCHYCTDEVRRAGFDYIKAYKNTESGKEIGTFYKVLFTHKKTGIKFIKIGITKNTVEERLKHHVINGYSYKIIRQIQDTNLNCAIYEQTYKSKNFYNRFYFPDDWEEFSGKTECYNYNKEQQLKYSAIKDLRNILLKKQGNVCAICKQPPKNPVLDHDHKKRVKGTSYCRGTLCSNCNIYLAKIENNALRYGITQKELPKILRRIADYKEADQTLFIHPSEKPKSKKLSKRFFKKLQKEYKRKYPNKKEIEYPKSGKLTKSIQQICDEFCIEPEYLKGK